MTRFSILLLFLTGCSATRPTPAVGVLTFPSELPTESAVQLARNVLRRASWPAPAPADRVLTTDWHAAASGPLRLVVTARDDRGGASTVVSVHGEQQVGERVVGVTRDAAAWPEVERIARQVGAGVRYALY